MVSCGIILGTYKIIQIKFTGRNQNGFEFLFTTIEKNQCHGCKNNRRNNHNGKKFFQGKRIHFKII